MSIEQTAINLTQELVRIPSESSKHTSTDAQFPEKEINEHLASFCLTRGIDFEFQEVKPGRSNFLAHFPKKNAPRLLITAHTDTVSSLGMDNAFSGEIKEDKIWGRGACDDKGPLAIALSTLTGLYRQKTKLAYDVTFAATIDEELTMAGSAALAKNFGPWDLCIGLEPTELKLIHAHKGIHRSIISTQGLAAHSSSPEQGRNAIIAMHAIMTDLQVLEFRLKRQRDTELGKASLAITQIHGGTSVNIIPDYCEISVDTRLLPNHDPNLYTKQLEQLVGMRGQVKATFFAKGIQTDTENKHIQKLQHAISQCGYAPEPGTVSYATDCSNLIDKAPCIVWGPGSISHAHQLNEHIELTQIKDACRILQMFLTAE